MAQVHADDFSAGDPLSPSFVGETMSTGMDLGLVQQAKEAGIIKDSNPLYKSVSSPSATYLGSTPPAGTGAGAQTTNDPAANDPAATTVPEQSGQKANVTGIWSLDLTGELTRHIDLNIAQNKDAIMGHGTMTGGNGTQRITASGILTGNGLSLTVMPVGSLDLYKLDLSLDSHTTGTYTAYSANGDTWSGDVTGTAPSGISTATPDTIVPDVTKTAGAGAEATGAGAESPIRIGAANNAATSSSSVSVGSGSASMSQGFSGSSSSSTSVSMVSSGGSSGMQSFSSMSGSV